MDKPLCPHFNDSTEDNVRLGKYGAGLVRCGKPMFANLPEIDSSAGLQITVWQCFSLNSHHTVDQKEPIPGWKKEERKGKNQYQGYKMSDERMLEISAMLANSIPQLKIAKELKCSCSTINNVKGIMLLAAIGTAIRGMK